MTTCGTLITSQRQRVHLFPRSNDNDPAAILWFLVTQDWSWGTLTAILELGLQHKLWMTMYPDSPH